MVRNGCVLFAHAMFYTLWRRCPILTSHTHPAVNKWNFKDHYQTRHGNKGRKRSIFPVADVREDYPDPALLSMSASSEDVDDSRALALWGSGWQDGAKFVRDIFSKDASKYSDEDFRKAAVLATSYTHLPKAPKTLEDYALDVVNLVRRVSKGHKSEDCVN